MIKPRRPQFGKLDHCECREISKERIDECIRNGATSVVAVFSMNRCRLDCGDCVPAIRRALKAQADKIPSTQANTTKEKAYGT